MHPYHLRWVAIILAAAGLLGCGPGAKVPDPVAQNDGPHQGGQLIVGLLGDVSSFNEYQASGESIEAMIIDMLFPTLMTEQPDFEAHPPSFAPRLAREWEFSQDNRTLTFRLRSDARWSDGTPVTAEDVRFAYRVQKSPEVGSLGYEMKDFITAVEVVDPLTVRFRFSQLSPYQLMDANDGHIVPEHAWGQIPFRDWATTDFSKRLVTCGPYRLKAHTPDQTIILERDPAFWAPPKPYLDRIVFRILPDATSEVSQLIAGEIDLVTMVPPREADRVKAHADLELVEFPARLWGYVSWNNRLPLFADRRVRRALSLAINRKALVDTVYRGHGQIAVGPILSTMWAFNRNLQPLPFDPELARRLLAEAGWRDRNGDGILDRDGAPFQFDLAYPSSNTMRAEIAVLMQADLARIGIRVRPAATEFTSFMAHQESGKYDAQLSAWDETTRVDLASTWATARPGAGSNNFIGYSNPEVDQLIDFARRENDVARAKLLLDRIQQLIVDDQPVTFLYEAHQLVGLSRHIRGADINATSIFFNLEDWYQAP